MPVVREAAWQGLTWSRKQSHECADLQGVAACKRGLFLINGAAILACRNCRVAISSGEGCAICLDFKKHLVNTDESADLAPSLSEVGSEAVSGLRAQIKHLKALAKDNPDDADTRKDMVLCINALAKLLEAARKLQDDGISAVRNMSFLERAKLFVSWYADLPPSYRTQVRQQVEAYELEINKPMKELADG